MRPERGAGAARIRPFRAGEDEAGLRRCVVELQDFERALDPRLPAGEDIADPYLTDLHRRCHRHAGTILVAASGAGVSGYAAVLTRVRSEALHEGDTEFGLIADLVVLEAARGQGLGRALLEAAEAHARARGVSWLRLGVLAANAAARAMYDGARYRPLGLLLEKRL